MKPHFRKTCKRYNSPGDAHYLTFSCFQRQPFLMKDRARQWTIAAILAAQRIHDFSIWAWVIMPEHMHLLIHPRRENYSISAILKSIKQPVTNAALAWLRENKPDFLSQLRDGQPNGKASYRFWQRGGGYDTNLWTPKVIDDKIQYTHNNPVRRKLVARATDWEWSSARDWAKLRNIPPLPLNLEGIPWH